MNCILKIIKKIIKIIFKKKKKKKLLSSITFKENTKSLFKYLLYMSMENNITFVYSVEYKKIKLRFKIIL